MGTATRVLVREHDAILSVLDVLEQIYQGIQTGRKTAVQDIKDILEFLKVFADKCHHGKEESFLFPELEKIGVRNESGPIGVMLSEHKEGRELIRQMNESAGDNTLDKPAFVYAATSYVILLRNHIRKENMILFPMGDSGFSAEVQEKLLNDFDIIDKTVIGEIRQKEFHALISRLKDKYL
jgi:hemerythrin-like domain-containing protein